MNISGLRNQFICMQCYETGNCELTECSICKGYCCPDLIVCSDEAKVVCFICQGTSLDSDEWPDWAYSVVPAPKKAPMPS